MVLLFLLYNFTFLRCKTCAIVIGSLKATLYIYLLTPFRKANLSRRVHLL